MAAIAGYLYGDSSTSPLEIDFIAFLRDAVDFAVDVLLCDARLTDAKQRAAQLAETTEKEIARAEGFVAEMSRALDRVAVGDPDSLAARCAAKTRQGAKEVVRAEVDGARASVAAEQARLLQAAAHERDACVKALESLLLRHVLPDAVTLTQVRVEGGTRYDAQLHGCTPYGLEWVVALEIPAAHLLSHVLRIDRIVERLEVEAPEEAGWIRKEVKVRPQRFDRLHLAELIVDSTETTIKLRTAPDGTGAGFDIAFVREPSSVQLLRVVEGGAVSDEAYSPVGEDVAKLQSLHESLAAMANELMMHKKTLVSATLDDKPVKQLETPRVLVERLIANIAPTVQEIAKRTLAPGELVIKRLLGGNHREELFVSRADLEQKLDPLPRALRRVFDPLKLWDSMPVTSASEAVASKSDRPPAGVTPVTPATPAMPLSAQSEASPPVAKAPWKEIVPPKPIANEAPRASEMVVGVTTQTLATSVSPELPPVPTPSRPSTAPPQSAVPQQSAAAPPTSRTLPGTQPPSSRPPRV
jgi:Tfp pilus assembly protein PilN